VEASSLPVPHSAGTPPAPAPFQVALVSPTAPASALFVAQAPGVVQSSNEPLFLGNVSIGAHVLRTNRIELSSGLRRKWKRSPNMRPVQVRLGSGRLFWAFVDCIDKFNSQEAAWRDLETWKMLKPLDPRFRSYELSISRHGALNVFKTVPQTDVAAGSTASQSSYTIRLPLNCPEQLRRGVFFHLDFGMDAREADEWYLALSLMIEPWYVILAKTDGSVVDDLIKLGLATITAPASTAPGASAHGYTAQEYSQPNDSARNFLEAAKQTAEGVAGWVETFVKVVEVSQPVVDGVLTKVPLVGAGFHILALGLSVAS
jgi:hypothetical protein